MAKKKTMSLDDLKKILFKYKEELRGAEGKTKKFTEEGKLIDVEVTLMATAQKTVQDAFVAVEAVCDQATLAIQIEE